MRVREREAKSLVTVFTRYIHPGSGLESQIAVDICDQQQALKYVGRPNAKVRWAKDGRIDRVFVKSWGDDTKLSSHGAGQSTTYEETIAEHPIEVLKIWTGSRFRKWDDKDGFNPRRFNPDYVPSNEVELGRLG